MITKNILPNLTPSTDFITTILDMPPYALDTVKIHGQKIKDSLERLSLKLSMITATSSRPNVAYVTINNNRTVSTMVPQNISLEIREISETPKFVINNGRELTAKGLKISIAPGITITLQNEGKTEINFKRQAETASAGVVNLVTTINTALRTTYPLESRLSSRFLADLHELNRRHTTSLARVGINIDENGYLSVYPTRLARASENGSLCRIFETNIPEYGAKLRNLAERATTRP